MSGIQNPFLFGKPVTAEYFIDRSEELARLKGYILDGRNVILSAPRRYGKTSLVLRAVRELDPGVIGIEIDCYALTSPEDFARKLAEYCLSHYPLHALFSLIQRIFSGIRPKVTIECDLAISLEAEFAGGEEDWHMAFELPQRLAEDFGSPVVVVFDEFQEMAEYPGLLKTLRSVFQYHTDVSYCFLLSRHHMMDRINSSEGSIFSFFGARMTLPPLPEEAVIRYVTEVFLRKKIGLDPEVPRIFYQPTKGHPHPIGRIGYELWQKGVAEGAVDTGDLRSIIHRLITDQQPFYLSLLDSLTKNQQKVLLAIASGEEELYCKGVPKKVSVLLKRWCTARDKAASSAGDHQS